MNRAECQSCGKGFNVPSAEKSYKCPDCGGSVRAQAVEAAPVESAPESAPPPRAAAAPARRPAGARARRLRDPDQRDGMREFSNLRSSITYLRAFCFFGVFGALAGLVGVLSQDPAPEGMVLYLTAGVLGGFMLLAGMGAVRAPQAPLFWSFTLAVPAFLWFVILVLAGSELLAFTIIQGLLVIGVSVAVWRSYKLSRLMAENPELRPERRVRVHRSRTSAPETVENPSKALAREFGFLGLTLLVLVPLFVFVVSMLVRRPSLEDAAERFEQAWASASPERMASFYGADRSDRMAVKLSKGLRTRDWLKSTPPLENRSVAKDEEGLDGEAEWKVGDGVLRTRWTLEKGGWRLAGVTLPEHHSAPIQPVIDRFCIQWRSGTLEELCAHFDELKRESNQRKVERMIERQGWGEKRPEVRDVQLTDSGNGRARANLVLADSKVVRTRWRHEEGRWVLTSFGIR